MNGNNRPPRAGAPPYNVGHGFQPRIPDGPPGRGFQPNFNQGRGVHHGRGRPMNRGPLPPPRGMGDRFGPPGRGFYTSGPGRGNFMGPGHPHGGRGFDQGRGGREPPPPPMNRSMGRNMPPPPPPPRYIAPPGIPPPPMASNHISHRNPHFHVQGGFNGQLPPNHHMNNHVPLHNQPMIPPTQHQPGLQNHMQTPITQQHQYSASGQHAHSSSQNVVHTSQPPPTLPPPTPPSTAALYTQEQIEQAWTEHTAPNSMKYYYNAVLRESTYNKPEALRRLETVVSIDTNDRSWVEYVDASSGKKYYSDGSTTTWEKPNGLLASSPSVMDQADSQNGEPPQKKKKIGGTRTVTEFRSKEEAVAGFKGLLLAKDIQPTTKWNDVMKACSGDSRWRACEILSQGERKQALAEYQTKRANELRDLERKERMRAKDAFNDLLSETLPMNPLFNPMTSRFDDIRDSLVKSDRFYAVDDESVRETIFLDFCEELRKRDERKKRILKRQSKESLFEFLKEHEENGKLSFASTWLSFTASLSNEEKSDSRCQVSPTMTESERDMYFSDFVILLREKEDEERRRISEERKRAEKAKLSSFREMLTRFAISGTIVPSTRFRDVEDLILSDPACLAIVDEDSNAPRQLYQDFVDEWYDTYRRDRIFLGRLVQPSSTKGINVTANTTYEEFCKCLLEEAAQSPEDYSQTSLIVNRENPISSARMYFGELVRHERGSNSSAVMRRNILRRNLNEESSEDEGEIIEDGEIKDIQRQQISES